METIITSCSVCHGDTTNGFICTSCSNLEEENKEYEEAVMADEVEAEKLADRNLK